MLKKLFEPVNIGTLQLKNRIMMTSMAVLYGSETGGVTQRLVDYYVERAKNGVGLIEFEATEVVPRYGTWGPAAQLLDSDKYLPGYSELAESIHLYGARVSMQLNLTGRNAPLSTTGGKAPVSASAIPGIEPGVVTRPLKVKEIDEIIEEFSDGAARAKAAGFDAVSIIGGVGYLVNQFLSPLYNKRTDEYGGSPGNRMKFALRIVRRIKEKLGEGFPVIFELNCDEFTEGGLTLDDAKMMVPLFEEAGVDAFRSYRATYETYDHLIPPASFPRGCFVHHAEGLKKVAKKAKVEAECRINDPQLAEDILLANKADIIGFGRAFIADPEWPKKAAEGRFDDIRKCIACNRCIERTFLSWPVKCSVNAAVGHERDHRLARADKAKKVVIVGGGPAGMEAARVAAIRGHKVVLFEKSSRLGGQLNLAGVAPHKEEMQEVTGYLTGQIKKLGVDIRLGEEATASKIKETRPGVVIIATGAAPLVPKILGIDGKNIFLAWDVLDGVKVGDKVVVVGGGMVGCETAEYLASKGKKVTIVEMLPNIANDVEPYTKTFLLERLNQSGVRVLTGAKLEEITDRGIIYSENSVRKAIRADAVVLALGSVSNNRLVAELKGKVSELYSVGDCVQPCKLLEAIESGFHRGRLI